MESCTFCQQSLSGDEPTVTLTAKGCGGIRKASEERQTSIQTVPGQLVHTKCRREFVNPNLVKAKKRRFGDIDSQANKRCALRSDGSCFDYKFMCLFCGCRDLYDGKKPEYRLIPVRTIDFQERICQICSEVNSDWSKVVQDRILFVGDLPAADAVYHQQCNVSFRTGRQIPKMFIPIDSPKTSKRRMCGRPKDVVRSDAFLKVVSFLEQNEDEQLTIKDLIKKMSEYTSDENTEPYSFKHMKRELKHHFGDKLIISEICGKSNVVSLQSTASAILQEFHQKQQRSTIDEELQIIETAAKLVKNDIKRVQQDRKLYPDASDLADVDKALEFVPSSLKQLLGIIFQGKDVNVKLASVGQAIMQATRPRGILAPLQLGLGVQLHHHFQSKFLIDSLNEHGFCCSYSEVKRFERCSAVVQGTDVHNHSPDSFLQYAADNVDHNIRTLDGEKTFHGMGIIATITPKVKMTTPIKRIDVSVDEIARIGRINIRSFILRNDVMSNLHYEPLVYQAAIEPYKNIDLLWKSSLLFKCPRPQWSGFMQLLHQNNHTGPASVMFLPMIDLDPNDLSCIYSTLVFVSSHAKRYNCTPVITFDQPLWWKANVILENERDSADLKGMIIRLGGFHILMSFLGCIGHLMGGSGLRELLELVYATNTVTHMLSGKAVARAVRGHLLIDAALHSLLCSKAMGVDPEEQNVNEELEEQGQYSEQFTSNPNIKILSDLMEQALSETISTEELDNDSDLIALHLKLEEVKTSLQDLKTSKLWIQYLRMIDLLRKFMKGERMGDWSLHLQCLHDMLPFFASSGHNLYLKSVYLYLQKMSRLEKQHPEVHRQFCSGKHVVRRSDRSWAGLSVDLVIEQCLMRSVKTTGGLTRGRGFTEVQRLIWVMSTPACAEVNRSMQELTEVVYTTSDQHKECTNARITKDMEDANVILKHLTEMEPFGEDPTLRNIASGVVAHPTVNVFDAKSVGDKIIQSMEGTTVAAHSFQKKHQVVTMDVKSTVKVKGEEIQVDPQLLFQRLVTAGNKSCDLSDVFKHELCSFPTALFDSKTVMRLANKSSLANAIWTSLTVESTRPNKEEVKYVLDGGALLHRIPWTKGNTWSDICSQYVHYVKSRYADATVVFDGYSEGASTKDCTHARRTSRCMGASVNFTSNMPLQMKKEDFLSNKENKQRFVNMLGDCLEDDGIKVRHASGDADVLIVLTAIESAQHHDTVLIGEDTDLLILLLHHIKDAKNNVFFRSEPRKMSLKPTRCWDIKTARSLLGPPLCDHLIFLHAISGCDTTSRLYGVGKQAVLTKSRKDNFLLQLASVFMDQTSSREEIIKAGETAVVCLYNGNPNESVDMLRLRKFHEKARSSVAVVQPHALPPSSAAVKYHSLRVYLQVQTWMSNACSLSPEEWGWKSVQGKMVPVLTDLPPAPQELLDIVRCNCKSGCNTARCTCRKNGLECSMACGDCKGMCDNCSLVPPDVEEDNDEETFI